ncbi:MAG: hypothetical protein K1X89_20270 [Myxococcaceae bacterium]|nr:hypothetical protein [Myxococcaceae bacterium]
MEMKVKKGVIPAGVGSKPATATRSAPSKKPASSHAAARARDEAAPSAPNRRALQGDMPVRPGFGLAGGESIELFARPETPEEQSYQQRFQSSRNFLETMTKGAPLGNRALGEPEVRINGERVVVRAPVLDAMMGQPMGAPLVRELKRAELDALLAS